MIFSASDPERWAPWRTQSGSIDSSRYRKRGPCLDAHAGARVKELARLLSYARRYWGHLLISMILMAIAGAATSFVALLVGPLLHDVLDTNSPVHRIKLYEDPIFHHEFFLNSLFQGSPTCGR